MKRIVCFLLAMVMLLGLIPMTAITANAASSWNTSSKAINKILTKPDRFQEYAQEGGYIGYHTKVAADKAAAQALYPNGISEDKALELLKDYLEDTVDVKINEFTSSRNVDLTQQQHDALAVFCMEEGFGWMTSGDPLYEAVRTRKTGNDFLNAIAQKNNGVTNSEAFRVLMNRRLAVANLYLNADYAYICPENYTYVVLDFQGSPNQVIAYNTKKPVTLSVKHAPEADFLGWYRKADINDKDVIKADAITKLNASTSRKTLVPKFNTDNATFKYKIDVDDLPSRHYYSTTYSKTDVEKYKDSMSEKASGKLKSGSEFTVTAEKMVDGIKWLKGNGTNSKDKTVKNVWIYQGELPEGGSATGKVVATATITGDVNIRDGATTNMGDSGILGVLEKGQTVNIYSIKTEKTETGNQKWGKVNVGGIIGWINLAYADVLDVSDTNNAADGRKGEVVNSAEVNIRNQPGTVGTSIITKLKKGTKVTILETKNVNNAQWGYVEWDQLRDGYTKGWIYMFYVEAEGLEQSQPGSTPANVKYTGVVTSNINLNVRNRADIYGTKVGELTYGTKVNVYETAESRNMKWGRIGSGRWVCLTYVDLTKVNDSTTAGTTTSTSLQATVSINNLSVYQNYNSNSAKVGTLEKGEVVKILERNTEETETGSRIWGRISHDGVKGWINLAYVELKTVTTVNGGNTSGTTGGTVSNANGAAAVVSNCISVNVRKAAGTRNDQITKLNNGTAIKVYDRVTKDDAPWARITWESNGTTKEGWVCMNYVTMAATGTTPNTNGNTVSGTNSNTISATGTVNSNINLRVRSGAGLSYADFESLPKGTKVTIYDQVTNDGMIWGRINTASGSGWICMSYVTVDNTSVTGKGVMGTIARCFAAANVRSAPGTGNALVGTVGVGKRVEVFETRPYGNSMWARIAQGWVCMDYVILDTELPPGTALDATQPSTEDTKAAEPEETINRDNEVLYTINGKTLEDLNVRNDASTKSDKIGSVKENQNLTILAVKNNGAELWGRIDQYATAGWVNLEYVYYHVDGFINTDEQPVYADPNTGSTVKGKLRINTAVKIEKLIVSGETVYGWYEDSSLAGWVPMGRISTEETKVVPTYRSSLDSFNVAHEITGTTNGSVTAYEQANGTVEKFYLTSGVTVYINQIDLEYGKVWGEVTANGTKAWINLASVTYAVPGTVNAADGLNVRKDKIVTDDTDPEESNILGTIASGKAVKVCELSFDNSGKLWGKVVGNEAVLNGGYVMMEYVNNDISIRYR